MLGAKHPTTQVAAAQERVQAGYRGQSLGVSHHVHGAGMSASGHCNSA
jgi:hypothetical protein